MQKPDFYTQKVATLYKKLLSGSQGITQEEALSRLETYGPNRIQTLKGRSLLTIVFEQFQNIFTIILLISSVGVWSLGETVDALVIGVVILINVVIGAIQEYKAEKTLIKLEQNLRGHIRIRRKGIISTVKEHAIVPGDIMILQVSMLMQD